MKVAVIIVIVALLVGAAVVYYFRAGAPSNIINQNQQSPAANQGTLPAGENVSCKPGVLKPGDSGYDALKRSINAFPCTNGCVASLLRNGVRMSVLGSPCAGGVIDLSGLLKNDLDRYSDYRSCMTSAVGSEVIAEFDKNGWALYPPEKENAISSCKKIAECHIDPKKCQ